MKAKFLLKSALSNTKVVLDYIFIATIVFLFSLIWCNFHYRKITVSILPAVITTAVTMLIIHFVLTKLRQKKRETIQKRQQANIAYVELVHKEEERVTALLSYALNTSQTETTKQDVYLANFLSRETITKQDIIQCVILAKKMSKTNIYLFCYKLSLPMQIYANSYKDFNFTVLDYMDTYKLLSSTNLVPRQTIFFKTNKINFKQFFGLLLSAGKTKSYFFIGLFLTFTTLFTPYKTYYAIFASIFFMLAVASKLYNTVPQEKNKYLTIK